MRHKKDIPAEAPVKPVLDQRVEEYMGPPPDEAPAEGQAPVVAAPAKTPAPIIPTEALPKEITQAMPPSAQPAAPTSPQDAATDAAIDDIMTHESDEVLAAEDDARTLVNQVPKQTFRQRLWAFLAAWWSNPYARWATILLLVFGSAAAAIVPTSRYFVLNTVGVRSSAVVTVLDAGTQQPLKNVTVRLAGQSSQTNAEGRARLERVQLGPTKLVIERRAFAAVTRQVTVGWGSNPLGDVQLTATGSRYRLVAADFLSGKPLPDAKAIVGDAEAPADAQGVMVLTLDNAASDKPFEATIKNTDYRDEVATFSPDDKTSRILKLVPARRHMFVSKRSGKYDVYAIDVDGKREAVVLKGTGSERDDIALASQPNGSRAAVVSTREAVRNKEGFLLSTLTIVDSAGDKVVSLGQSERIQVIDWVADRLVYVQVAAGTSASNPKRHRLMSYDVKTEDKRELAASNYFNDVVAADGGIYYAPSGVAPGTDFYKVNADGTGRQTLLNKQVYSILRTQYERLSLSANQEWYEYKFGDVQAGKVSGAPPEVKSRVYRDSPDKRHSLWVDNRDGKGVLLQYTLSDKKDTTLRTQSGLANPVYWLSNKHVVYRIHTEQESADYVVNLEGGELRKIRDVTNTLGVSPWYYY